MPLKEKQRIEEALTQLKSTYALGTCSAGCAATPCRHVCHVFNRRTSALHHTVNHALLA